jgi:hypothetical protein
VRIGALTDSSARRAQARLDPASGVRRPDYLARNGEPETPHDLAAHNCLLYSYQTTANVWRFTAPDGRRDPGGGGRQPAYQQRHRGGGGRGAGWGISCRPTFYVGALIRENKLKQVLAGYKLADLGIFAVYPQKSQVPPKVRAFIDFMAQRFGRRPSGSASKACPPALARQEHGIHGIPRKATERVRGKPAIDVLVNVARTSTGFPCIPWISVYSVFPVASLAAKKPTRQR